MKELFRIRKGRRICAADIAEGKENTLIIIFLVRKQGSNSSDLHICVLEGDTTRVNNFAKTRGFVKNTQTNTYASLKIVLGKEIVLLSTPTHLSVYSFHELKLERVLDLETQCLVKTIETNLCVHPLETSVVLIRNNVLFFLSLDSCQPALPLKFGVSLSCCSNLNFSPDGSLLGAISESGSITLIDLENFIEVFHIQTNSTFLLHLCFHPKLKKMYVFSKCGKLKVFLLDDGVTYETEVLSLDDAIIQVQSTSCTEKIYCFLTSGTVGFYDTALNEYIRHKHLEKGETSKWLFWFITSSTEVVLAEENGINFIKVLDFNIQDDEDKKNIANSVSENSTIQTRQSSEYSTNFTNAESSIESITDIACSFVSSNNQSDLEENNLLKLSYIDDESSTSPQKENLMINKQNFQVDKKKNSIKPLPKQRHVNSTTDLKILIHNIVKSHQDFTQKAEKEYMKEILNRLDDNASACSVRILKTLLKACLHPNFEVNLKMKLLFSLLLRVKFGSQLLDLQSCSMILPFYSTYLENIENLDEMCLELLVKTTTCFVKSFSKIIESTLKLSTSSRTVDIAREERIRRSFSAKDHFCEIKLKLEKLLRHNITDCLPRSIKRDISHLVSILLPFQKIGTETE
eukprot:snap_masked-scaffold_4-processed-gene-11.45-mRNA-1 protein AED:1.00 eAED:1.00 QI:0/-1/0/0/-1/1/1/0/630